MELPTTSKVSAVKDPGHNSQHTFLESVLSPVFTYGRLFFIIPFKFASHGTQYKFETTRSRRWACYALIAFLLPYWILRTRTQSGVVVNFGILNALKALVYSTMCLYGFCGLAKMPWCTSSWKAIFESAVDIERQWTALLSEMQQQRRGRQQRLMGQILGVSLCLLGFFGACFHYSFLVEVRSGWAHSQAMCLLNMFMRVEDEELLKQPTVIQITLAALAFTVEILCWNTWYFFDTLRMALAIAIWFYFRTLSNACRTESTAISPSSDLDQVVDLHMRTCDLLRLINDLLSSATFFGEVSMLFFRFYYINYVVGGFDPDPFSFNNIAFAIYYMRTLPILLFAADASAKAHDLATWVEHAFATDDTNAANGVQLTRKWSVFIARLYGERSAIGFKGLGYFTITYQFLATVVSLLMTYCVVLLQFMKEQPQIV